MPETVRRNFRETVRRTGGYASWVFRLLLVTYILSGIYVVSSQEVGVLVRFGQVVDANVKPGIHFAFPQPFDRVYKVPVKLVQQVHLDVFTQLPDSRSQSSLFYNLTGLPSYCISGDNNIVTVSFIIKYMIVDPRKYLFSVADSEMLLKSLSATSMVHILATIRVDEILTYGKQGIENRLREELRNRLEKADSGLGISFVELKSVSPPEVVQKYFDDVINAGIDRKKLVHQAESYREEQFAAARSRAERMRQEASAYKKDRIARAEGEAERFLTQLTELGLSGSVTKKRLYLEFVQSFYPNLENIILVDSDEHHHLINLKVFPNRSNSTGQSTGGAEDGGGIGRAGREPPGSRQR